MWSSCPKQYQLKYIDKLSTDQGSIATIFGTAMHLTLQKYLEVFYNDSKVAANLLNLNEMLQTNIMTAFHSAHAETPEGLYLCTLEDLEEHYEDGMLILNWFKKSKNQSKFFIKRGYELVGIEIPIDFSIRNDINVVGFIDIVLKSKKGYYTIIDFKTSTKGWGSYKKSDDKTKNQILLYKKWYSEQYKIPIDKIYAEFHILKRKISEEAEYPIPRITRFAPAQGTPSVNKAWTQFMSFVDDVFDEEGNHKIRDYEKKPGKICEWCEFSGKYCFPYE
jgi:ATP-dependent exoDNAse (exonuclease V) beta subunit